ncbi:Cytochrome P450 [Amycolatopsis pretoriensis]|uniref:Cytochrome P450 n=1 Tax=Amycolatopsis pretoriensis TaxID=218821 RepID=A0A1H5RI90_9PSEU|nr:cytochrome P450 [Amycolatopsis pretoriensis]SEF37794.1 Cytochrome P450 [Amycolatopsis pretoriensis]
MPDSPQYTVLPTGRRAAGCPLEPAAELTELRERPELPRIPRYHPFFGQREARAVTRYGDVRAVFGHDDIGADLNADPDAPRTLFNQPGFLLGYDGPEHLRLRRLLAGAFTVRRLRAMEPAIGKIVTEHLDAMEAAGPGADLVPAYALPIPSLVICDLLGVPHADRADFQHRSAVLLDATRPEQEQFANYAAMHAYMAELVTRLRAEPGDGLLGGVIAGHGDEITDEELVGFGNLLLIAGHETTSNTIALGTLALLRDPEQLAAVRDDPEVATPAIEDLLRYLSVVTYLDRRATTDVEVDGHRIAADEWLSLSVLAANHDPALVGEPGLDVRRKPVPHLAFGFGAHQCLGQQLARMELKIALPALLRRFPDLRLTVPFERLEFRTFSPIHGVTSVPVTW